MAPAGGISLPVTLPISPINGVALPSELVPFKDVEVHPDLWILPKLPAFLALLLPDTAPDAKDTLYDQLNTKLTNGRADPKNDLERALNARDANIATFGAEAADQSGDFKHYFHALLSLNPRDHKNTMRLISLVYAISGVVGMAWKLEFMRERPAHVWPGLFPALPTPPHPSFPSNHATQANAVSIMLSKVVEKAGLRDARDFLKELANRIAHNREYMGIHFSSDTKAGELIATDLVSDLMTHQDIELTDDQCLRKLIEDAAAELKPKAEGGCDVQL